MFIRGKRKTGKRVSFKERFVVRHIVKVICNIQKITFKAQADAKNADSKNADKGIVGTSTSVESFMGQTGKWEVEVASPFCWLVIVLICCADLTPAKVSTILMLRSSDS